MDIERTLGPPYSYVDALERIMDKGIVVDAWVLISVSGIDLITVETQLIVASIETYLAYCPTSDEHVTRRSMA